MRSTLVTGRFVDGDGNPIQGMIRFRPQRLWVEHEGHAFATMEKTLSLDEDGGFVVALTPTHGHDHFDWHYTMYSPLGKWTIKVPESDKPVQVKSLLPDRFSK